MACSYQFELAEFGIIDVYETSRARNTTLRILPDGKIRVSVNPICDMKYVANFIRGNADKIKILQNRIQKRFGNQRKIIFSPSIEFATRDHKLVFRLDNLFPSERIRVHSGLIEFIYQSNTQFDDEHIQTFIRRGINFALKVESEKYVRQRITQIAQTFGLKFTQLAFRDMKSRWGSCCKATGHITLNIQMMRLPQHLIDYLIIHELCHLVEANHGRHFHELVNNYCNGHEASLDKELKQYHCDY